MTFIGNIRMIVKVSVFGKVEVTNLTLFRIENTVIANNIFIFWIMYSSDFIILQWYNIAYNFITVELMTELRV